MAIFIQMYNILTIRCTIAQVSYVIVDEMHEEYPKMMKDQYWNEIFPSELPYTDATKHLQTAPFLGSAQVIEAQSIINIKKSKIISGNDEQKVGQSISSRVNIRKDIITKYLKSIDHLLQVI